MIKKYNFSYDILSDDLFLYDSTSKSRGSIEIGDIIIDFDNKKELVALQFINASKTLKDMLLENKDIKEILKNLKECKIQAKTKENILIIRIELITQNDNVTSVISIPKIERTSPSLAYA